MSSEQRLQILASIVFSVGLELERSLDWMGRAYEAQANRIEDALNRLTAEWPDIVPIRKEDRS
jgi:hypothetical protein